MTLSSRNPKGIADFHDGSYQAIKELSDEHYALLVDFATQLVLNKAEAHHIVQETFIKLFLMRDRFDSAADIKAFLYITVRNICFTFIKAEKDTEQAAATEITWYEPSLIATARYEEHALREDVLLQMDALVKELPASEKTIFHSLFYDRQTIPAVAEQLSVPAVTVTQRRIRAIRLLRDKLIKAGTFSVPLYIYFIAVFCGRQKA